MATSPDDDADMKARLAALSGALDGHRKAAAAPKPAPGGPSPSGMGQAMSLGFRVMSEFVAAVVVGGFIGYVIDLWLKVSPIGLIVFGALGTISGFWNVYRIAAKPTTPRDSGGR
jgi:ATP synthase protein I